MGATTRPFFPQNRQGITVDSIAIVADLILFPYLLVRIGGLFDRAFEEKSPDFFILSGLMVFVLAARLAGLYLKRFPLQTRLEDSGQTSFPLYFFLLNIGVFVMNAAFAVVFVSELAERAGLAKKDSAAMAAIGTTSMCLLMSAEVYLIYKLCRPLTATEKHRRSQSHWLFDRRTEFAANFGLLAYVLVWHAFYNDAAKTFLTPAPNTSYTWDVRAGSAIFVFVVFLLFYFSPRTVFLIEDRKHTATWLFIFAVYLISILQYS